MPLRFHVPLPGPFTYSRRVGGRRPSKSRPGLIGLTLAGCVLAFIVANVWGLLVVVAVVGLIGATPWWRRAAERNEQRYGRD